jgi:hypothetical protein
MGFHTCHSSLAFQVHLCHYLFLLLLAAVVVVAADELAKGQQQLAPELQDPNFDTFYIQDKEEDEEGALVRGNTAQGQVEEGEFPVATTVVAAALLPAAAKR